MISLGIQEKLRKPVLSIAKLMHSTRMASVWLRLISATQRFIVWQSPYIRSLNATVVFDIGANTGEFAMIARSTFPKARIYSFEPQPLAWKALVENMEGDGNFKSFNCALGSEKGSAEMFISEFSPSSSFYATEGQGTKQLVPIELLNDYAAELHSDDISIVKLDVEGYELEVLKGGLHFLQKADWIYIESRTNDLVGCSFDEIYSLLNQQGWRYRGAYDAEYAKNGKLMYFDALFYNEAKHAQK